MRSLSILFFSVFFVSQSYAEIEFRLKTDADRAETQTMVRTLTTHIERNGSSRANDILSGDTKTLIVFDHFFPRYYRGLGSNRKDHEGAVSGIVNGWLDEGFDHIIVSDLPLWSDLTPQTQSYLDSRSDAEKIKNMFKYGENNRRKRNFERVNRTLDNFDSTNSRVHVLEIAELAHMIATNSRVSPSDIVNDDNEFTANGEKILFNEFFLPVLRDIYSLSNSDLPNM